MSALLAAAVVVGCEPLDPTQPSGDATVEVRLSDAAATLLAKAEIDIGAIELVAEGPDSTVTTLTTEGTNGYLDLLEIVPTNRPVLAEANVPADRYVQLRLAVERTRVTLALGYGFADGTAERELTVPAGASGGLRLNLDVARPLDDDSVGIRIRPGVTILYVDVDAIRSYTVTGDPDLTSGIEEMLFTPRVRVVADEWAGSVAGTVTGQSGARAAGLVVTAAALDEGVLEAFQTQSGTAVTAPDGSYAIDFLVPGRYSVSVAPDSGDVADPVVEGVTLNEGQEATGIDFTVSPESGG